MINYVYQLVSPKSFSIKYEEINFKNEVVVKPTHMAICHADQRYYTGNRDIKKLKSKLPMALIHEAVGKVVFDSTGNFKIGQSVVMIPNIPGESSDCIYENYQKGSKFRSSGIDGFMKEFVNLPYDRIVAFNNVETHIAAICEFISVAVHAISRFKNLSHNIRKKIGIWGDGSLGYVVACILKKEFPNSKIIVIGKDSYKLSQFWFADETIVADDISSSFNIDHAFECAGGAGSYFAIKDIIKYINPQGTVMLMGVSENEVPIYTRDILEKGLTFVGSSRSGRKDFEKAVELLENIDFQNKIKKIIFQDKDVKNISDIHRVFENDLSTPFKTVFKWDI